ncbi:MAG: FAD-dependent oxidoreductase [Chloroflexota bacterium]|nr:FAD-dependent oxidoreductase [Chloroflexota bacterium]
MASDRIVVIGAGVMGTWTAYWLQARGHAVTLVDSYGAGNSLASSGDESRVTRSAHGADRHYPRWQRRALAHWRELEAAAGVQLFVPSGVLWFAHTDDGFEAASIGPLRELEIPIERLSAEDVARRWPVISPDDLGWALHEPEAGALLARRGVALTAAAFGGNGGELRIGRVLVPDAADASAERLRGVRLADGSALEADAFVFACGPWLPGLFPQLLGGRISVTRQELVYVAPPPGDARFDAALLPTWVDYDRAFYGIGSIEGRGMKCAPDWPGPPVDPDRQERRVSDATVAAVRGLLRARFPSLAERPVAEGRVCQYESTADTNFIIDRHPVWANAWIVGGGSGHGFKHGPVIGELVAAGITGDEESWRGLAPPDRRFALTDRPTSPPLRTSGIGPSDLGYAGGASSSSAAENAENVSSE